MNENHDEIGRFAEDSGSKRSGSGKSVRDKLERAHAKLDQLRDKVHHSHTYHALAVKDRFTRAVPPGSKRDKFVKQAAMWSEAGLQKAFVVAAGGGPAGVAGVTVAAYTKWGGHTARQFAGSAVGKRLGVRLKKFTSGIKAALKKHTIH